MMQAQVGGYRSDFPMLTVVEMTDLCDLFRFDHDSPRFVKWFDPVAGSATNDARDEETR